MSESYYGGINLSKLMGKLGEKHSAFTKDKNGQIWCNITFWVNENTDEYGNNAAAQLAGKDHANEGKVYIGNFKKNKPKEIAVASNDIKDVQKQFSEAASGGSLDDLPFDPMFNNL